jgi:hypothetical protein
VTAQTSILLRVLAALDAAALTLVAVAAFGLVPLWAPVVAFAVALPPSVAMRVRVARTEDELAVASHAAALLVRSNGSLSHGRRTKALGELAAALDRANGHEQGAQHGG